jgi:hypothetical protein
VTYVEGRDTPRSVWEQDQTPIENFTDPLTPKPGNPEVGVVFLAPPSGRVLVVVGGQIRDNAGINRVFLKPEIYRGTSAAFANLRVQDGSFHEFVSSPNETQYMAGSRMYVQTGLRAGYEHYARVLHWAENPADPANTAATSDVATREIIIVPLP